MYRIDIIVYVNVFNFNIFIGSEVPLSVFEFACVPQRNVTLDRHA